MVVDLLNLLRRNLNRPIIIFCFRCNDNINIDRMPITLIMNYNDVFVIINRRFRFIIYHIPKPLLGGLYTILAYNEHNTRGDKSYYC